MRIWSIHPKYLDTKGLLALWRETLLAKAVLNGDTIGYQNHSQLSRFKALINPLNAINAYLSEVWIESQKRGYNFDKSKIDWNFTKVIIYVKEGQIKFEVHHLLNKLKIRDQEKYKQLKEIGKTEVHPIFEIKAGGIEVWEKISK